MHIMIPLALLAFLSIPLAEAISPSKDLVVADAAPALAEECRQSPLQAGRSADAAALAASELGDTSRRRNLEAAVGLCRWIDERATS